MANINSRPGKETLSETLPIDQKPDIVDSNKRPESDLIIRADPSIANKDQLAELAFNEEPVTIRLEPSSDPNAASAIPIWCNGIGCEYLRNDRWVQAPGGYIPVGAVLTIKRKYLAILVMAKQDKITTHHGQPGEEHPQNTIKRFTSSYQAFSVLEDKNPKGAAWLTELRRLAA
jgi:hypothetical protein